MLFFLICPFIQCITSRGGRQVLTKNEFCQATSWFYIDVEKATIRSFTVAMQLSKRRVRTRSVPENEGIIHSISELEPWSVFEFHLPLLQILHQNTSTVGHPERILLQTHCLQRHLRDQGKAVSVPDYHRMALCCQIFVTMTPKRNLKMTRMKV